MPSAAVRSDGTLWTWGGLIDGAPRQFGTDSDWKSASVRSAGSTTFAIKDDGSLWGWGKNEHCKFGFSDYEIYQSPIRIGEDMDWAEVHTSTSKWVLGLKRDGTIWAWGTSSFLGISRQCTPVQIGAESDWVQLAAEDAHFLGLKSDGSIWSWGQNSFGKLGLGDEEDRMNPTRIGNDNDWRMVFAGLDKSGGVKADGLYVWGGNLYQHNYDSWLSPVRIGSGSDWVAAAAGHDTIAVRADGTLWRSKEKGVVQIGPDTDWEGVAAHDWYYFAVKKGGKAYAWGRNDHHALGIGNTTHRSSPTRVETSLLWKQVDNGHGYSIGISEDGSLWRWGNAEYVPFPLHVEREETALPVRIGTETQWAAVDTGPNHAVALKNDGSLWSWGRNLFGALGRDFAEDEIDPSPGRIGSDSDWKDAAAGSLHGIAVKEDGTLWGWGRNSEGQLGIGIEPGKGYPRPVRIGSDSDWVKVSAGFYISGATKEDGTLWLWGQKYPLDYTQYTTPTMVSGPGNSRIEVGSPYALNVWYGIPSDGSVKDASLGDDYSMWILSGGALWGEGINEIGQLGVDTCMDQSPQACRVPPMQIGADTDWKRVATPEYASSMENHTIAIKEDGTLWSWGSNSRGQLGIGLYGNPLEPQPMLLPATQDGEESPVVLWRHLSRGENALWYMDGASVSESAGLPGVGDTSWRIAGSADFNGDGKPDILWRNLSTGENFLWYMDRSEFTSGRRISSARAEWEAVAVADFSGDGKPDILWSHSSGAPFYVWFLDDAEVTGGGPLTMGNPDWRIAGAADFNGDGRADLLWRHAITGRLVVWYMEGLSPTGSEETGLVSDFSWQPGAIRDFDGDGDPDILWRNHETGMNYLWFMDGALPADSSPATPVPDTEWCIED